MHVTGIRDIPQPPMLPLGTISRHFLGRLISSAPNLRHPHSFFNSYLLTY